MKCNCNNNNNNNVSENDNKMFTSTTFVLFISTHYTVHSMYLYMQFNKSI